MRHQSRVARVWLCETDETLQGAMRHQETTHDETQSDTMHESQEPRHQRDIARKRREAMSLLGWVGLNSVTFRPHIPILNNRVSFLDPWFDRHS